MPARKGMRWQTAEVTGVLGWWDGGLVGWCRLCTEPHRMEDFLAPSALSPLSVLGTLSPLSPLALGGLSSRRRFL